MEKTKIAILGLGTVGSGVARLLLDQGDHIARHAGRTLWLEKVVVRNMGKMRDCDLPAGVLTDCLDEVIENSEIAVVAQLIGGIEPARTIMLRLLESGKDVVTANKALLAECGSELFDRARELGRSIAFEAAVAGGVPIVANICQCLSANAIQSLEGILNGTSNFILSQMVSMGTSYEDAVAEAQRLGFAEADPAMDVDGSDAAQKLAILAQLAFGTRVAWDEIPRQGIDTLDLSDVQYAHQMGYQIKLLAVARRKADEVELHVSPTLVRSGSPLAGVQGAYNAVSVVGDAVGDVFFHGLGAGQMPTASAVVADLIDTAVGRTALTFGSLELWSGSQAESHTTSGKSQVGKMGNYADVTGRFYLRVMVLDHPGVLAQVMTALGTQNISIASVLQHEIDEPQDGVREAEVVPLVIMTHVTTEGAVSQACQVINSLDAVRGDTVRMWVRE
jgi:homoserine dehydrogenase